VGGKLGRQNVMGEKNSRQGGPQVIKGKKGAGTTEQRRPKNGQTGENKGGRGGQTKPLGVQRGRKKKGVD